MGHSYVDHHRVVRSSGSKNLEWKFRSSGFKSGVPEAHQSTQKRSNEPKKFAAAGKTPQKINSVACGGRKTPDKTKGKLRI